MTFIFVRHLRGHLSDETLSRSISGELGSMRDKSAKRHLETCWQCRRRRDEFERAALRVVEFRNFRLAPKLPLDSGCQARFERRLDDAFAEAETAPRRLFSFPKISISMVTAMSPVLASVAIVCGAIALLLWALHRPNRPMTASVFLSRAIAAEQSAHAPSGPGVIYQKVEIRVAGKTVARSLYRDRARKRLLRLKNAPKHDQALVTSLSTVGIEWSDPLSAQSFQAWHDNQRGAQDRVENTGPDLLTLTTTVPSGEVRQSSLTVRESDFHPVQREIETRTEGTIEIAEISYASLDWAAIDPSMFEPEGMPSPAVPRSVRGELPPSLPTEAQLDETELNVRVTLDRLHADMGEQISIGRGDHAVEVRGVVDTEQRKRELIAQLRGTPHVVLKIESIDELASDHTAPPNKVSMVSVEAHPSPLALYLKNGDVAQTSQRLLEACLRMQQGATDSIALRRRFADSNQLSVQSRTDFDELISSYRDRMNTALDNEASILQGIALFSAPSQPNAAASTPPPQLADETQRNAALCSELIASASSTPRPAVEIGAELTQSIQRLRTAIVDTQSHP